MSTTDTPDAPVQHVDRRRAAQIRQRQFERRLLQGIVIAAGVLLLALIIVLIINGTKAKKLATLNATITSLQTENATLKTTITELEAEVEKQKSLANLRGSVDGSFFDDALIVGDSVSVGLQKYVEGIREDDGSCLGTAQFYTAGALSWSNLLLDTGSSDAVFPTFGEEVMRLEDAVVSSHATKVYLMLGVNDIAAEGVETTIENVGRVIAAIREKAPDVAIIIQSTTPMTAERQTETLNNDLVSQFNTALKTWCEANNAYYLDLVGMLAGEDGALNPDYCSDPDDMGIQLNDTCCEAWVKYLLQHPYGV